MGTGHGMIGMHERVKAVGGTFAAGPRPGGGFRVEAELPLVARESVRAVRRAASMAGSPDRTAAREARGGGVPAGGAVEVGGLRAQLRGCAGQRGSGLSSEADAGGFETEAIA